MSGIRVQVRETTRFYLEVENGQTTYVIYSPKCRCGSCEDLVIEETDNYDCTTDQYEYFFGAYRDGQIDVLVDLVHDLAEHIFKQETNK